MIMMRIKEKVHHAGRDLRLYPLYRSLRHETTEGQDIQLKRRGGVALQLSELGIDPDNVFFKSVLKRAYNRVGPKNSVFTEEGQAMMIAGYLKQTDIAMAIPEHAPMPIGLGLGGITGRKLYGYFMMRVPGRTLASHLATYGETGRLELDLETIMDKLESVLDELHSKGIGHGDVRAKNIMITPEGEVVLIDPRPLNFRLRHSYRPTSSFVMEEKELIDLDKKDVSDLRRYVESYAQIRSSY